MGQDAASERHHCRNTNVVGHFIGRMRYLFIATGILFLIGCSRQTNNRTSTDNHADEVLTKMQGTWIHTDDSLATVEISSSNWTFNYTGTDTESSDKFLITISDTLTRFVDKEVKADFLILSNAKDT